MPSYVGYFIEMGSFVSTIKQYRTLKNASFLWNWSDGLGKWILCRYSYVIQCTYPGYIPVAPGKPLYPGDRSAPHPIRPLTPTVCASWSMVIEPTWPVGQV